jgi:anhydro-N-acetylmuramic acid kinase
MNKNILQLYNIAQKNTRLIIGLMSGTSLDGLDVALCSFTGSGLNTKIELLQFETVLYDADFKSEIKNVFSKKEVDLEKLTLLNPWIGLQHANIINGLLKKWSIKNSDIDIVASHGQTIYHAPKILHAQNKFGNATLQIGDGDHIAVATGIITISDFRQKHIAAGGEGAPLAVYGDYLIFGKGGEDRILLNIGGIANFTFLPGSMDASKVFSTDVGPGNTMMDAFVQQHFPGKYFDEDAAIAKQGTTNENLLHALKQHDFFKGQFPKTTGPELFNINYLLEAQQQSNTNYISVNDVMATLTKFSADMIVEAMKQSMQTDNFIIYSSGGGMHNPLLMQHIKDQLPNTIFKSTKDLNINPDAKEAVLFAVLANEALCGEETNFGKAVPSVSMGKVSFAK